LGATVFNDVNFAVWPDYPYFPGMLPTFKFFRGRTIIIDRAFAESCEDIDIKRVNYTFPHEIFHLENHETKITAGYHVTQANEHGQKNTLEQEADYASSLFWMPKAAVENVFIEEFKLNLLPTMSLPFNYFTKPIIQKMAKIFDVNYSPMVYRLQELDLINRRWG
jgi:Zn-dependent peptidase ImmA (M78 family)